MKFFLALVFSIIFLICITFISNDIKVEAKEAIIPDWIRNNALWWSQGLIEDEDFIFGMKFLIDEEIMIIPHGQASTEPKFPFLPNWIKDTAGWWATKKVSNTDFVNGMEYLITNGYMTITIPTIECLGECLNGKITRIVDGDTVHVDGKSIRFALTSTPELDETGGPEAKEFLQSICPIGSQVIVDKDDGQPGGSYDRMLAVIYCDGLNLNEEMLDVGLGYLSAIFCSVSEFSKEDWAIKHGC